MNQYEWDADKERQNRVKHGVSFYQAQKVFLDPLRIIVEDLDHSDHEKRWFCLGKVMGEILTLRFTHRSGKIRIIGAGYWRKGKKRYEEENKIHR